MLIVIMNNRGYNATRIRAISNGGILVKAGRDFTSYLGSPDVDFTKIAEAYGLRGEKVRTPDELAPALQRAIRSMKGGKAVLMDIDVAREGYLSESTWYPRYSIAEDRKKA